MMATRNEMALRLDATLWLLGAGMGKLPLPLYDKLIDYREELKEALGPGWYLACKGKLKDYIECSQRPMGTPLGAKSLPENPENLQGDRGDLMRRERDDELETE